MTEAKNTARVLVADDSRFFRSMLAYALEEEGLQCTAVEDGRAAIAALESDSPFHLVLLDLMMPGATGFDVVGRMREVEQRAEVPVIVISQYALNAVELDVLRERRVRVVLTKSTTMDRILFEIHSALHPQEAEQRHSVRTAAALGVAVRRGLDSAMTTTFNLSESGMFLVSSEREPPPPGSPVILKFWIPGADSVFEVEAAVVWVNAPGPEVRRSHPAGYAVEFVDLSDQALEAIRGFVREQAIIA